MGVVGGLLSGETGVGLRSSVDNADAPVSPLRSEAKELDFRRGLAMLSLTSVFDVWSPLIAKVDFWGFIF